MNQKELTEIIDSLKEQIVELGDEIEERRSEVAELEYHHDHLKAKLDGLYWMSIKRKMLKSCQDESSVK